MTELHYTFDSGDISLDFANTNDWHASEQPVETILNFDQLVLWGEEAGLLSPERASRLRAEASISPVNAERSYRLAIDFREAIYRILSARYAGEQIAANDLQILNDMIRQAMAHLQLAPHGPGFNWEWTEDVEGTNLILWPVARSAAELLASEQVRRVRQCEDERCGYLFIDQSKNGSRRWCSMESCGNRAKARRHYAREKRGESKA